MVKETETEVCNPQATTIAPDPIYGTEAGNLATSVSKALEHIEDKARNKSSLLTNGSVFTVEVAVFLTSELRVRAVTNEADLNRTLSETFKRYERQVCGVDRPPASECVVETYYKLSEEGIDVAKLWESNKRRLDSVQPGSAHNGTGVPIQISAKVSLIEHNVSLKSSADTGANDKWLSSLSISLDKAVAGSDSDDASKKLGLDLVIVTPARYEGFRASLTQGQTGETLTETVLKVFPPQRKSSAAPLETTAQSTTKHGTTAVVLGGEPEASVSSRANNMTLWVVVAVVFGLVVLFATVTGIGCYFHRRKVRSYSNKISQLHAVAQKNQKHHVRKLRKIAANNAVHPVKNCTPAKPKAKP